MKYTRPFPAALLCAASLLAACSSPPKLKFPTGEGRVQINAAATAAAAASSPAEGAAAAQGPAEASMTVNAE